MGSVGVPVPDAFWNSSRGQGEKGKSGRVSRERGVSHESLATAELCFDILDCAASVQRHICQLESCPYRSLKEVGTVVSTELSLRAILGTRMSTIRHPP